MPQVLDKLSLRTRILLFFLLIAASVPIVIGAALAFAATRLDGNPVPPLVLAGGLACFALIGLVMYVWNLFDLNVARPIGGLARDIQTVLHSNSEHEVEVKEARYLGLLAPTVCSLTGIVREMRSGYEDKVAEATRKVEIERQNLEAIIRDLDQGVLVCNRHHQILLYNRKALTQLRQSGELGLARSMFTLVQRTPFSTTVQRLTNRLLSGRYKTHKDYLTAPITFSSRDGQEIFSGKMTLLLDSWRPDHDAGAGAEGSDAEKDGNSDHDGETPTESQITGYVLTFEDVNARMAQLAAGERVLREAIEGFSPAVGRLSELSAQLPAANGSGQPGGEAMHGTFSEIRAVAGDLSGRLDKLEQGYDAISLTTWPMGDVYSSNLLTIVVRRYRQIPVITVDTTGEACWVHCDTNTVVEVVDKLIRHVAEATGAGTFSLQIEQGPTRPHLLITWEGDAVDEAVLSRWTSETLDEDFCGLGVDDVLAHHRSQITQEPGEAGEHRLRMPLLRPIEDHVDRLDGGPPIRFEYYDFDLLTRGEIDGALHDVPLEELTFVVFDTETTGLEPSNGDEIISIAGVRVVNGRVLTGEKFDHFVNPQRSIPQRSTLVHGISEDMVKDAPPITDVLPKFRDFVGQSVLVAHNAAFDLKFLELKEPATGIKFDSPVLDTVLLSAFVHDHTDQHTLDAVADRFGIVIPPETRHTAFGDSLATAHVLTNLIPLLRANGIATLGEALEASEQIVQIRRAQSKY